MRKIEKGFGAVEILIVIAIVGLVGIVGWLFFNKQQDSKTADSIARGSSQQSKQPKETSVRTLIYPTDSHGMTSKEFYTVTLPSGWSVENVFEPYDIVKTIGNSKYLISSFVEENSNRDLMSQRVAEGIETVSTVKTSLGTLVNIFKTPTTLFLAACKPTGENCYLQLNDNKLYIHLYQVIPHAQSVSNIDYSSRSASEIINDFESIAKSLSI